MLCQVTPNQTQAESNSKTLNAREVDDFAGFSTRNLQRAPVPGARARTLPTIDGNLHGVAVDFERRFATDEVDIAEFDARTRSSERIGVALIDEHAKLTQACTRVTLKNKQKRQLGLNDSLNHRISQNR